MHYLLTLLQAESASAALNNGALLGYLGVLLPLLFLETRFLR